MQIPRTPPSLSNIANSLSTDKLLHILNSSHVTDQKGRYLHWDELRYKQPPEGLLVEEWWLQLRFARQTSAQTLPLKDIKGNNFVYVEPPELKKIQRYIDMNAGGFLGGSRSTLNSDDGKGYMRRSLLEEPFHSSLIEGAVTTRDIAKKIIFENRKPRTKDERMVMNNFNGMEFIKTILRDELTPNHILELHRIMTKGTLDNPEHEGALRTNNDNVHVVDDSTNEILHTPPRAEDLMERLHLFCEFANAFDESMYYCHPLIKAIILHFMLAYEHPFADGNGRTARALFYWYLLKEGYWLIEYTSISGEIAKAPINYYRAFLYTETDGNDLTYFLLHQARATEIALQKMHIYAEEKRQEFENFHRIVNEQRMERSLNERQTALIQNFILNREKSMEIYIYQKRHKISYLTARSDLEDLVARGLVKKGKEGRSSIYTPLKDISNKISNL